MDVYTLLPLCGRGDRARPGNLVEGKYDQGIARRRPLTGHPFQVSMQGYCQSASATGSKPHAINVLPPCTTHSNSLDSEP